MAKDKHALTLGETYTDKLTGFTGVATARVEYLTQCVQYMLEGPVVPETGKSVAIYFDDMRLVPVGVEPDGKKGPGPLPMTRQTLIGSRE